MSHALPADAASRAKRIPLAPPRKRAVVSLVAFTVALPLAIAGALLASAAPAALAGALLAGGISLAVAGALLWAFQRNRLELDARSLTLVATFYRQQVPLEQIDIQAARVVDLGEQRDLRPRWKTNGFGLPSFAAGHFRLADGSKAFCLVTDPARVLVLPRRDGSKLLLSPEQPRALLDRLRAHHAA